MAITQHKKLSLFVSGVLVLLPLFALAGSSGPDSHYLGTAINLFLLLVSFFAVSVICLLLHVICNNKWTSLSLLTISVFDLFISKHGSSVVRTDTFHASVNGPTILIWSKTMLCIGALMASISIWSIMRLLQKVS